MKYSYEVRNGIGDILATVTSLRSAKVVAGAEAIRKIDPTGNWTVRYLKTRCGSGRRTKTGFQWLRGDKREIKSTMSTHEGYLKSVIENDLLPESTRREAKAELERGGGWKIVTCDQCGNRFPTMVMLTDEVWKTIYLFVREVLCIKCMELRLNRSITPSDLKPCGTMIDLLIGYYIFSKDIVAADDMVRDYIDGWLASPKDKGIE